MLTPRIIPCLLLKDGALVKGVNFSNHRYLGDPLNAIRIFNQKEASELILIDIEATQLGRCIDPDYVDVISKQCSMPLSVGGGVQSVTQARKLISSGAEKVVIGSAAFKNPQLIREVSEEVGNQSVVVSVDVRKNSSESYEVWINNGTLSCGRSVEEAVNQMIDFGAGEIMLNSIDRDGTMSGYDLDLLKRITSKAAVPVIALGGAGNLQHLYDGVKQGGVSAVAAGSLFVFHGRRRAILVNYPAISEVREVFER